MFMKNKTHRDRLLGLYCVVLLVSSQGLPPKTTRIRALIQRAAATTRPADHLPSAPGVVSLGSFINGDKLNCVCTGMIVTSTFFAHPDFSRFAYRQDTSNISWGREW